ncbi:hypothetical protein IPV08_16920 [Methylobacterium sp. SD274]|uniref:hypothetical protein n=1 Tax=Methylobacterium sp. SD274 TaxID=2782009 RepID=UPI001A96EFD5|nr:hypothetical protein [Methylobacterium sp. SD274]MBO1021644.1 hypothetical protein [Methylobacterium sp. SD274]
MSTERAEGYREALSTVKSTIQRRISDDGVPEDGKRELSNLLVMLDDMLQPNRKVPEAGSEAPEPLSGSF